MPKDDSKKTNRKDNKNPTDAPLKEGIDFYMEDGFFVLTAQYLRNRGYCCGNGCRHCPYEEEVC